MIRDLSRWLGVLALTGIAGPAFAQYCSPSDPSYDYCTQQEQWKKDAEEGRKKAEAEAYDQRQRDEAYAEEQRHAPDRAEQARQYADNDAALKALRARLLASPPLPPERNPLLGNWRVATGAKPRGGDDLSKLMGMLTDPGGAVCEAVFGGGTTEFKPGSWAANDSAGNDSLGPIQYRMQGKQVFALPEYGVPLLGFDIVNKDRIQEFRLQDCALVRVGVQPAAAPAKRAATPATPAAAPAKRAAAPATGAGTSGAPARAAGKPIDPNSPLGRGVRLHGEKDFQPALQQLLAAAEKDPNDSRVYAYLADTYNWLGMAAEASQAAERAKRLDPNAFDVLR